MFFLNLYLKVVDTPELLQILSTIIIEDLKLRILDKKMILFNLL